MKHYLGVFLGMAFFIMAIPCFSFAGISPKSTVAASSLVSSSNGQAEGSKEVFSIYHHKTKTVETLSAADYIKRVVAAEMPAHYHTEALKAQAVAAHSYAIKMKKQQQTSPTAELKGADISTDPATSQSYMTIEEIKAFYGDQFEANYKKISDAVDAVINQVILYEEEPIAAAFHAISGGTTEDAANIWGGALPYLKPVLSDGDQLSPDYQAEVTLTRDEVKQKLSSAFPNLSFPDDPKSWMVIQSMTASKSVKEVSVCGKTVSGSELRSALGLSSPYFSLTYADDSFTFQTKGKGHGVGMSQYGADYLARQGKTYDEILTYYYQGVTVATLKTNTEQTTTKTTSS